MSSKYQIDRDHERARHRLTLKQGIQDPTTIGILRRIGICQGWRCLEAGAGGGSIAAWLCTQVAAEGEVVATDINTSFLDQLDLPNLTVLQHDLATDELPAAAFDLVHARDLLVHIPERDMVVGKLAGAVKPGGWILLEEPDGSTVMADPTAPESARYLYATVMNGIYSFLCDQGLDPYYGAMLMGTLRSLGFLELQSEARCRSFHGGPDADQSPHTLAFREVMDRVVSAGAVGAAESQEFLALLDDPGFSWREDLTVSAWGRRAG
jgi:ubiquinone/menaquinone biosynthesis C-methylase UbiE